ncbi:MAG: STAS domain-containing protein [Streptosporangiaceae bacterium]
MHFERQPGPLEGSPEDAGEVSGERSQVHRLVPGLAAAGSRLRSSARRPFRRQTLPATAAGASVRAVQEGLRSALSQRPAALVVDMTPTIFCHSAGVRAVMLTHREAADAGCEVRLVISSPGVMRVFSIIGADQLAEVHSGLASALHATAAQGPDANGSNGT